MKIEISYTDNHEPITMESDGEGRWTISGTNLPRQDGATSYTTEDGLHVLGLLHLIVGATDSREYLTRRLREHREQEHLREQLARNTEADRKG